MPCPYSRVSPSEHQVGHSKATWFFPRHSRNYLFHLEADMHDKIYIFLICRSYKGDRYCTSIYSIVSYHQTVHWMPSCQDHFEWPVFSGLCCCKKEKRSINILCSTGKQRNLLKVIALKWLELKNWTHHIHLFLRPKGDNFVGQMSSLGNNHSIKVIIL